MGTRRLHLKKRGQRWWFQIAVPERCRASIGRGTIEENLRTADQSVAQAKALERAGYWRQRFAALTNATAHPSEAYAAARASVEHEIDRIGRDIPAPEQDERISLIFDWALDRELSRLGYSDASELQPGDLPPEIEAALLATKAAVQGDTETPVQYGTPFSKLAAAYLKDRQRPGSRNTLTPQTVSQMEAVYRLYADHSKDAPIATAMPRAVKDFFDKLKRLDANWGRSRLTKTRKFDELLALSNQGDVTPLSDRTLFRYMIALNQVWDFAKRSGDAQGDSPFSGQIRKGEIGGRGANLKANAAWSDAAIKRYFVAHTDASEVGKPDPFHWLPRIALLSGMRIEEICSLTREDIKEAENVIYFDIVKGKTTASTRVVPIHSGLAKLLELVPTSGFLFPDLVPGGPDKKRSAQIGKRLGRRFKKIEGGSTFHAFRHNAAQTFERERVPQTEAAQIIGHGKKGMTYGVYSRDGLRIDQKQQLVELLYIPGME